MSTNCFNGTTEALGRTSVAPNLSHYQKKLGIWQLESKPLENKPKGQLVLLYAEK